MTLFVDPNLDAWVSEFGHAHPSNNLLHRGKKIMEKGGEKRKESKI